MHIEMIVDRRSIFQVVIGQIDLENVEASRVLGAMGGDGVHVSFHRFNVLISCHVPERNPRRVSFDAFRCEPLHLREHIWPDVPDNELIEIESRLFQFVLRRDPGVKTRLIRRQIRIECAFFSCIRKVLKWSGRGLQAAVIE
jgi:hypothetical protein